MTLFHVHVQAAGGRQMDRRFLFIKYIVPRGLSALAPGLYTCIFPCSNILFSKYVLQLLLLIVQSEQ